MYVPIAPLSGDERSVATFLAKCLEPHGPDGVPANEYLRVVPTALRQTVSETCGSLSVFVSRHSDLLSFAGDPSAPRLIRTTNGAPTASINVTTATDDQLAHLLAQWAGPDGILASDYLSCVPKHCRGIVAGRCGALAGFVARFPQLLTLRGTGAHIRLLPAEDHTAPLGSDEQLAIAIAGWVGNGVPVDSFLDHVPVSVRDEVSRRLGDDATLFARRFPATLDVVAGRLSAVDRVGHDDWSIMEEEKVAQQLAEWVGQKGVPVSDYLRAVPRHVRTAVSARVGSLSRFVARYPMLLMLIDERLCAVGQNTVVTPPQPIPVSPPPVTAPPHIPSGYMSLPVGPPIAAHDPRTDGKLCELALDVVQFCREVLRMDERLLQLDRTMCLGCDTHPAVDGGQFLRWVRVPATDLRIVPPRLCSLEMISKWPRMFTPVCNSADKGDAADILSGGLRPAASRVLRRQLWFPPAIRFGRYMIWSSPQLQAAALYAEKITYV
jgi:hypothetical protein